MSTPQTINSLMRHLRNDCHIQISGSYQKKQLVSYGYYHGYKGYRFIKNKHNQIPYTDFSEVVAVIEYDNNLKAALYSDLMFVETSIKNIVCNESVNGLKLGTFEHVYKERMRDNTTNTKLQSKRLKLRNSVYSKLSIRYHDEEGNDNQMVRHFYNRGEDAPLWVVFEILYLSDLASFFECLNEIMRERIMTQLNMFDVSLDTNRNLLSSMLYTIKSLRNSVAHNNIIFDTRFKDRKINPVLKKWIEKETSIQNITLYSLIDYIIIVCCLLKRVDFSSTRAKSLVHAYKEHNQLLQNSVAPTIYGQIIQQNVSQKITTLEIYLNT
ncbi:Abi family protein [Eubacteriales bacterium DFI.9.88]|nr:Abi family protein [Eubacteriales bacterium DFI.9.88]